MRDEISYAVWMHAKKDSLMGILKSAAQQVAWKEAGTLSIGGGFTRTWTRIAERTLYDHGDAIDSVLRLSGPLAALVFAKQVMEEERRKR